MSRVFSMVVTPPLNVATREYAVDRSPPPVHLIHSRERIFVGRWTSSPITLVCHARRWTAYRGDRSRVLVVYAHPELPDEVITRVATTFLRGPW